MLNCMSLKNLLEYGKAGLGVALTSSGINADIGAHRSCAIVEEVFYRSLESVSPETMLQAKQSLDAYMYNNAPMGDGLFSIGLILMGTALVTSGIYNLVKNYRTETKK
jgi:hypothetical protein